MKLKASMKTAAAAAMFAFAAPAYAGGVTVFDDGDSKLKIESLFYLNTFSQTDDRVTSGVSSKTKTSGLAVDRAYFTAKYYFNKDWYMRFTSDMGQEAALGKDQNIYLKYAYVEGKLLGSALALRVGQSHTPWIDYEQKLWGHRYVAKVMSDQYKFDTSSDLGFGVKGKLADGVVDYFATLSNGSGYGKGTRTNGMDYSARLGLHPVDGLDIDFQYMTGNKGTKTHVANVATAGVKSNLMQGMISYGMDKDFRVGFNYISNKDKADSATASSTHGGNASAAFATAAVGDEVKSTGMALWGWAKFAGNMGVFGRYETLKNKFTTGGVANANQEQVKRYVVGVEYSPIKNVTFALVADETKLDNRGGNTLVTDKDTRFGLYSQIKL